MKNLISGWRIMKTSSLVFTFLVAFTLNLFAVGENCTSPHQVTISGFTDLPQTIVAGTCGMGNYYDQTCMGHYDNGEDYLVELTVTQYAYFYISLDPGSATYSAIAMTDQCPLPDGYGSCLAFSSTTEAESHGFSYSFAPGIYYLMIDTWPAPDCIDQFTLKLSYPVQNCMSCDLPCFVELPADDPYMAENNSTCGKQDTYLSTCLGNYDQGEDMFYQIEITEPGILTATLDPVNTSYTGIALDSVCPPGEGGSACMAMSQNNLATPYGFSLHLTPGIYHMIIDNWPSPECIASFDLEMGFEVDPVSICGDPNSDGIVDVADAVYTVNYALGGGPEPDPYDSGDVNCDQSVDISDAVYIINYIFGGGNEPCDPDGDGNSDCP